MMFDVFKVSACVIPAVGSSSSSTLAFCTISMPSSSHCVWPWLRLAGDHGRLLGQPDEFDTSSTRALAFAG